MHISHILLKTKMSYFSSSGYEYQANGRPKFNVYNAAPILPPLTQKRLTSKYRCHAETQDGFRCTHNVAPGRQKYCEKHGK